MAQIYYPENEPEHWNSPYWKVEVHTDQYNGVLHWTHFMSGLTGSEALRVANNVGDTFQCPIRTTYELGEPVILTSEEI